jgi:cell division protein FtsB
MASALIDSHSWRAEMPPLTGARRAEMPPLTGARRAEMPPLPSARRPRAQTPQRPVAPVLAVLPDMIIAPAPIINTRVTRAMFSAFMALATGAMGLYMHTVRIEGDANHQQHEIRELKEGNHYLQVQLAETTNLERVETQAVSKLNMVPRDESVFMALPKEVSDLAQTTIIPGREPTPTPVWPGF